MILEMLYATCGERIFELLDNIPEPNPRLKILIVHQINSQNESVEHFFSERDDVRYFSMFEKGVTKSRNFALTHAIGDIVLFCDDDVVYTNFVEQLIQIYEVNPSISGVTLSYSTPAFGVLPKFKKVSFIHTLSTILSIGTIEVSVRLSSVRSAGATFPEDLGAGTKFFCCDEPVFLSKLIKFGSKIIYFPLTIGLHPDVSSGLGLNSYPALFSRLIAFRYIYGYLFGTLVFYAFCLKNFHKLSPRLLFFSLFSIFIFNPQ
ncbi:glycosyltransferase family 2 protein [Shewanella sp. S-1]|uniref:Glycosyltransferase family 2 protein n=1 Tax=Shewanella oncorhynchi TaxID=2726434 RepID=A0ABX1KQR6_9GAMM|nr:glycosyltransferase family A protein [Shewanella oncorhynchi]NLQ22800.1 glycosyltransferase family 2 protein [Shewanella oncorhynchi]